MEVSGPLHFAATPVTNCSGRGVGPRTGLYGIENIEISCFCRESNHSSSDVQPVTGTEKWLDIYLVLYGFVCHCLGCRFRNRHSTVALKPPSSVATRSCRMKQKLVYSYIAMKIPIKLQGFLQFFPSTTITCLILDKPLQIITCTNTGK
jgi:hypothetical protein